MKYFKHKVKNLINIKNFVTIHYFEIPKDFTTVPETHNFWELLFVETGELLVTAGDRQIRLRQNEIVFHRPNELHSFCVTSRTSRIFIISFETASPAMLYLEHKFCKIPDEIHGLFKRLINEANSTFVVGQHDPLPATSELVATKHPNLGGEQLLRNYLEEFLILFLRIEDSKQASSSFLSETEFENNITDNIIGFLNANLGNSITIEDVCHSVNYGKTYISVIFKRRTGRSIISYFMQLKLDKAKQLLSDTDSTITEIADILNFNSPSYFTKVFKIHVGVAPLNYRNSFRPQDAKKPAHTEKAR